jgi:drug/metabolite transporter (DMT)-like permease
MNLNFRKGVYLAIGTAIFSGVANFVNKFALTAVGDPLVHTTLKNSLVAILIVAVVVILNKLELVRKLSRRDLALLVAIGVIGGSLPFYLFFSALAQMPAINASLIHKTLIFWVALLAVPFLRERISIKQIGALGLILSANLVVGGFKGFSFSKPELMVLGATVFWAIENVIAKVALRRIDSDIVVASRMGIGSLILLTAVGFTGKTTLITGLNINQFLLVTLTSIILFGYVTTWYRALKTAPVTLVATVLTLATIITNVLSAIFVTHKFTFEIFAQFTLIAAGSWFFLIASRKISESEKSSLGFST